MVIFILFLARKLLLEKQSKNRSIKQSSNDQPNAIGDFYSFEDFNFFPLKVTSYWMYLLYTKELIVNPASEQSGLI